MGWGVGESRQRKEKDTGVVVGGGGGGKTGEMGKKAQSLAGRGYK